MSNLADKRTIPLDKWPPRTRVSQAATYLNCTEGHVIDLIKSGQMKAVDTRSRGTIRSHFLVERSEVAAFEARNKAA